MEQVSVIKRETFYQLTQLTDKQILFVYNSYIFRLLYKSHFQAKTLYKYIKENVTLNLIC